MSTTCMLYTKYIKNNMLSACCVMNPVYIWHPAVLRYTAYQNGTRNRLKIIRDTQIHPMGFTAGSKSK
uniref:Uncharacterized protein n=1 Tax=Rhizophora mucronata TaxID=61149 RepID=A0A2P2JD62_RHIMU